MIILQPSSLHVCSHALAILRAQGIISQPVTTIPEPRRLKRTRSMYDVTQNPSTGTPVSYTSPMYVSIPLGILTAPKDTKRSIKRIKRIKAELDDDVVDLTMVAPDPPKLLDPSLRGTVIDLTLDD